MPPPTRWTPSRDLAERYGHDEIRVTHEQNVVLPHVALADLPAVYRPLLRWIGLTRQCRPDHRHHRLPGAGLLRAGQRPLDPGRAGDFQPLRRS
jgi:hypothetical protein